MSRGGFSIIRFGWHRDIFVSYIHRYGTLTPGMNEKIAGYLLARILVIPID